MTVLLYLHNGVSGEILLKETTIFSQRFIKLVTLCITFTETKVRNCNMNIDNMHTVVSRRS